jgi:hypothetical protein
MTVLRVITFYELIKIAAFERISLEGEILVCPEIIDPELLCPGFFRGRLFVKEENIRLYSLGIK